MSNCPLYHARNTLGAHAQRLKAAWRECKQREGELSRCLPGWTCRAVLMVHGYGVVFVREPTPRLSCHETRLASLLVLHHGRVAVGFQAVWLFANLGPSLELARGPNGTANRQRLTNEQILSTKYQ